MKWFLYCFNQPSLSQQKRKIGSMEAERKEVEPGLLGDHIIEWLHDGNIDDDCPTVIGEPPVQKASKSHQTNHIHNHTCEAVPTHDIHRDRLISELFRHCQQAWRQVIEKHAVRSPGTSTVDASDLQITRNEAGRFTIWGDGFEAGNGGLDEVLDGLEALEETVVLLIATIAQKLLRHISQSTTLSLELRASVAKARYKYPEAFNEIDDSFDAELDTTISELTILNDCLLDLSPSLETIPISIKHREPDNAGSHSGLPEQESPYAGNVRDKFPAACENLIRELADINWNRHKMIRDMRTRWENSELEPEDQATIGLQSSYARDSGYQTMNRMDTANFQSQTSRMMKPMAAPSISSFGATTNAEEVGRTRYPPPPVDLGAEIGSFQCSICYKKVEEVTSKLQWRKHVIRDIQPYNCSFPGCDTRAVSYSSRSAWINHEFTSHRFSDEWICIQGCGDVFNDETLFHSHLCESHGLEESTELREVSSRCYRQKAPAPGKKIICPLCKDEIPETLRSLRRHIGHHLEEIALAALPPEIYHMDNGTGDGATGGDVENTDRNTEVIASSNDSEGGNPLLPSDLAEATTADTLSDGIQQTEQVISAKPTVGHRATPNPDFPDKKHSKTDMYEDKVYVNDTRRADGDLSSSFHDSPGAKKSRTDMDYSPEDEVNTKGPWKCLYYEEAPEVHFHCKDKRYKHVSELRRHINTHTIPHCCSKCGYRTSEERQLQNHKCEPGNRKKYSPITEEDRLKHEQLASLGIKIGQMRMILFGKKSDAESVNGDDETEGSESSQLAATRSLASGGVEMVPGSNEAQALGFSSAQQSPLEQQKKQALDDHENSLRRDHPLQPLTSTPHTLHPSPMSGALSYPNPWGNAFGMERFSLSDCGALYPSSGYYSEANFPYISQLDNHSLSPIPPMGLGVGDTGMNRIMGPPPAGHGAGPPTGLGIGEETAPQINILYAPPQRQPTFPDKPGALPDDGALSLPPKSPRRQRAKSDPHFNRLGASFSQPISQPGSREHSLVQGSTKENSLCPPDTIIAPVGSPVSGSTSSRMARRCHANSLPNRAYILELAHPNHPGVTQGDNKRVQKRPATFQCNLCPKRFTRAYNLRSHLRTHIDERPFVCTICGKAFARQHDRKRHEGFHSGEKKFVCRGNLKAGGNWGCTRRFDRADALGRHFRSEAGRVCIRPLLDEETAERQRQQMAQQPPGQMMDQVRHSHPKHPDAIGRVQSTDTSSMGVSFPSSILEQYPALATMSWGSNSDNYSPGDDYDGDEWFKVSGNEYDVDADVSDGYNNCNNYISAYQ